MAEWSSVVFAGFQTKSGQKRWLSPANASRLEPKTSFWGNRVWKSAAQIADFRRLPAVFDGSCGGAPREQTRNLTK